MRITICRLFLVSVVLSIISMSLFAVPVKGDIDFFRTKDLRVILNRRGLTTFTVRIINTGNVAQDTTLDIVTPVNEKDESLPPGVILRTSPMTLRGVGTGQLTRRFGPALMGKHER